MDLEKLSLDELRELAKANGVEKYWLKKEPSLIKALSDIELEDAPKVEEPTPVVEEPKPQPAKKTPTAPAPVKHTGDHPIIAKIAQELGAIPFNIRGNVVCFKQAATGLEKTLNLLNCKNSDGEIDVRIACLRLRGMGFI